MTGPTVGELFAGMGGFGRAFDLAGFRTVWQVECDPNARKVLAKHWPDVPKWDDVRTFPPPHWTACLDDYVKEWYNPRNQEEVAMAGKLKKLTPAQAEECVRMYQAGLSCGAIGNYFGITRSAMWQLLQRRTDMRKRERYGKDNHFYRDGPTADDQAQNLLETAISQGLIQRRIVCEQCGATGAMKDGRNLVQAHHFDYNKPLEVLWLCQKCHHMWHKNNQAKRKEVPMEVPQVDLIAGGFP